MVWQKCSGIRRSYLGNLAFPIVWLDTSLILSIPTNFVGTDSAYFDVSAALAMAQYPDPVQAVQQVQRE